MLDVTPQRLWEEIESAIKARAKVTDRAAPRIRQYAQNFQIGWEPDKDLHENTPYEHVTNWVPELVYLNPAADVSTYDPNPEAQKYADGMDANLNQWIHDVNLAITLDEIAYDVQFSFGMGLLIMEPVPGYHDDAFPTQDDPSQPATRLEPLRPRLVRLSPSRTFADPMATCNENARYVGHTWVRDKDDLLQAKLPDGSAMFDRDAINDLVPDVGLEKIYDQKLHREMPDTGANSRNQIVGYEIYVRETGKIYTLAHTPPMDGKGGAKFLRKARDYYGHPQGPYIYFHIHLVPDMLYPLSPLAATEDISEEISKHVGQMRDDAGRAKQIHLVDASTKGAKRMIKDAKSGEIWSVPKLQQVMMTIKVGGADPAQMEYVQQRRLDLERRTGLTNLKRGQTDPNVTATADAIADRALDKKIRYAQSKFRKAVTDILVGAAWLMHHSDQYRSKITLKDETTGEETAAEFFGGEQPIPFNALRISIEPYSMEYVDEGTRQRRVMQAFEITTKAVPMLVEFPFINAENLLDDLYEANNIRGGARRYIDMDILMQMREQAQAAKQLEMQTAMAALAQQAAPQDVAGPRAQGQGPKQPQAQGAVMPTGGEPGMAQDFRPPGDLEYDPVSQTMARMRSAA